MARRSERDEQKALFQWARNVHGLHPALRLLHAIPNGQYRPGQRKEPGIKAGVPDVCLPVPRDPWHGLYIEMKVGKAKPRPEQRWWLAELEAQGYKTAVCYSSRQAISTIEQYLGIQTIIGGA